MSGQLTQIEENFNRSLKSLSDLVETQDKKIKQLEGELQALKLQLRPILKEQEKKDEEAEQTQYLAYEVERTQRAGKTKIKESEIERHKAEQEKEQKCLLPLQAKLIKACERGDLKEVQAALEKGAKKDGQDEKGKHPYAASIWGSL